MGFLKFTLDRPPLGDIHSHGHQAHGPDRGGIPERTHRSVAVGVQPGYGQGRRSGQTQDPKDGRLGRRYQDDEEDGGDIEQPKREQQDLHATEEVAWTGAGAKTCEDLRRLVWHQVSLRLRVRTIGTWVLDVRA